MNISDLIHAVLYDPQTGLMTWRSKEGTSKEVKRWNTRYSGKMAFGSVSDDGYLTGTINKKHIKAHRAAWAIFHGYWPKMTIDHVNGDRSDNRICNIREATSAQNAQNLKKRVGGLSIYRGVSKDGNKWRAIINANGSRLYIGSFDTEEKAAIAYDLVSPLMHGEFSRPNIVNDRDAMTAFIEAYVAKNAKRMPEDAVRNYKEQRAI